MSSHLTRRVFRCLIANENIIHDGCLRRQAPVALQRWRQGRRGRCTIGATRLSKPTRDQRRTIFNFSMFGQSQRERPEVNLYPGLDVMTDLVKRQRISARLPEVKSVERAVDAFLKSKKTATTAGIPDTQASLLLQSLKYLLDNKSEAKEASESSTAQSVNGDRLFANLILALDVLYKQEDNVTSTHVDLARLLCQATSDASPRIQLKATQVLTMTLCQMGKPGEAREYIRAQSGPRPSQTNDAGIQEVAGTSEKGKGSASLSAPERATSVTSWYQILSTFAKQGNEVEVLRTLELAESIKLGNDRHALRTVIEFYASRDDLPKVQEWLVHRPFGAIPGHSFEDETAVARSVLCCCLRTDSFDVGHIIVNDIMVKNPHKLLWDEILAFALGEYKSVEEINRMLDVMVKSNQDIKYRSKWRKPDIVTINRLIETAIADQDPYLAERLISLGKDRGIEPDARTLTLQMKYRLSVNDVDGALIAYKHLQAKDLSANDDVATTNKLIVALCSSKRHDFDTIMNVAADLTDRQAAFEPPTVQALAVLHLRRDEMDDVQDLVRTHAQSFTSAERARIRRAFIGLIVDDAIPLATLWDGYRILRDDFDEMAREERTEIMQSCFDRKRPDLAVHVFNHMRLHSRDDTKPDTGTYVAALLGATALKDDDTLDALHNQLRLDATIDTTTRLRNALMIAYAACGQCRQALSIWDDIVDSREGPTYNSLHIAFRACEKTSFGDLKAREIWQKLRKNNIDLNQSIWASYIAALAGDGDVNSAVSALEDGHRKNEVEIDSLILGSLYNAAIPTNRHHNVQAWASTVHKQAWDQLQLVGTTDQEYREPSYLVDRGVTP